MTSLPSPDNVPFELQLPDLPRLKASQLAVLRRIDQEDLYILRDPARVGAGLTWATVNRLHALRLITIGDYEPLRGKRLHLTDLGRTALGTGTPKNA
ncbi:hypothetical protein ACFWXO_05450 [Kitasatospora sp. NPDC059088]|uniref:hypothetical protein n=1 Tax=Kitasatospora sp. NPDC059088 TaxID=3346722 RepID=UPI0036A65158